MPPTSASLSVEVHTNGWVDDDKTLDTADAVVFITSGSDRRKGDHPLLTGDRLALLDKQAKRGCGVGLIHWATFVPKDKAGDKVLDWVGGYFDYETGPKPRGWYSKITTTTAKVVPSSGHPAGRGLEPFDLKEEFYHHIKFREKDARLTPLLTAPIPGEGDQVVAWGVERADGGRGFGFTGGHFFANYEDDNFRRFVLNSLVWLAKAEVPAKGVASEVPGGRELAAVRVGSPIRAAILTGHDGPFHDWRATSQALKGVLELDPRFDVQIVDDPEFLGRDELQHFDLLVQNYVNWEKPGLSDEAKAGLLKFVESGRGLAVIHFANGAFHASLPKAAVSDWPDYRKLVPRVWDHAKGKSGHDAFGSFRVEIADAKHPITAGLKPFDAEDELYYRQQGTMPADVLVTAKSKDTKADEPLAWAAGYGKGRVFQTVLGHSAGSIRKEGPAALIRRGCTWAAGRTILGDPKSLPVALVAGKFGKALDARVNPVHVAGDEQWRRPPLTVEAWVKPFSKSGFNVFVSSDPKESAKHWELYSFAGTGAVAAYLPGYEPAAISSTADVCDGRWHHVAFSFDGKTVTLYADGKKVAGRAVSPAKTGKPVPGPLYVGRAVAGDHKIGCDALVDDVRISNVVRAFDAIPAQEADYDKATVALLRFDADEGLAGDPAWTPPPLHGKVEAWEKATDKEWTDERFRAMNTGPFLDATFKYESPKGPVTVYKGTAIKLGDKAAVLYDRGTGRLAASWTGDFLNHSNRRFGLLNTPTPAGTIVATTPAGPGWADKDGKFESKHPATAPLPKDWVRYKGLTRDADRVILHWQINGEDILEEPAVRSSGTEMVFVRRIERTGSTAVVRPLEIGERSHAVATEFVADGRLAKAVAAPAKVEPLEVVTKGVLGAAEGTFALDTLTIPYDNPAKALFFVTGVDFLPNGDVAVCTAHGDVWTVSGVDAKLDKLTWRRFATGLYQPLGLKVVDGKIVVLERGQLTRLHDNNGDGVADFYECVSNDWHTGGGEH